MVVVVVADADAADVVLLIGLNCVFTNKLGFNL